MVSDSAGNIYGTTFLGGASGLGTLFELPSTNHASIVTLLNFNSSSGASPYAGVTLDGAGDIIGTTEGDGLGGDAGTIFDLSQTQNTTSPIAVITGSTITVGQSSLSTASIISNGGLNIQQSGTYAVAPSASTSNRQLLEVNGTIGLNINISSGYWASTVDLGNNDLELVTGSLATITSQLQQGFAGGSWIGPAGITSSAASGDTTHLTALGVIQNDQAGVPIFSSSNLFDDTVPGTSDILVKYTYYGDANLDGKVDGSDYGKIDNGFLLQLSGWLNGDFNYDGVVNGSDYTLIDNAFNRQGAQLSAIVDTASHSGTLNSAFCSTALPLQATDNSWMPANDQRRKTRATVAQILFS